MGDTDVPMEVEFYSKAGEELSKEILDELESIGERSDTFVPMEVEFYSKAEKELRKKILDELESIGERSDTFKSNKRTMRDFLKSEWRV